MPSQSEASANDPNDAIGTDDLTPFTAAEEFDFDGIADKGCLIR